MEEEFVPKKKEETNEEVKKEPEVKPQKQEFEDLYEEEKKGKIGRIISRIFGKLVFLFVLFEAIIGVINMQKINDDEKPVWCFKEKTEKTGSKTETTCDLGLYVIVKTVENGKKTTVLKPFFLK